MKNVWSPNFISTYVIMALCLTTRMTLFFALPKVNVFIQCKISFKIVKTLAGKTLYSFLTYFIAGNILNSNLNTKIIKEILCLLYE